MTSFPEAARVALGDSQLRHNLRNATTTIREKRARVVEEVPDWEALREAGRAIKADVMARLDEYLVQFEESVQAAGGTVHWARDAAEANRLVLDVARSHGADEVVKVKSLTTDELELNRRRQCDRDRLRRADPPARRRLVFAHPRARDPSQPRGDPRPLHAHDRTRS